MKKNILTPPNTNPSSPVHEPFFKDEPLDLSEYFDQELDWWNDEPDYEHHDSLINTTLSRINSPIVSPSACTDNKRVRTYSDNFLEPAEEKLFDGIFDLLDEDEIKEEVMEISDEIKLSGLLNDHNYCSEERIKKKTKILIPLKDLIETLQQQKSYLISSVGPGKKIIRLSNGESVTNCLLKKVANVPCASVTKNKRKNIVKVIQEVVEEEVETIVEEKVRLPVGGAGSMRKKTKAHNNMERMRRIDLRNSFEYLRKLVPVLGKAAKCSKVEILRRSEEYIRGLKMTEKKLIKEENIVRGRNEFLRGQMLSMN